MRFPTRLTLLPALVTLAGCGGALDSQQPPAKQPVKWTTGFWLWHGAPPTPAPEGLTLDVLYFQSEPSISACRVHPT